MKVLLSLEWREEWPVTISNSTECTLFTFRVIKYHEATLHSFVLVGLSTECNADLKGICTV